MNIPNILSLLCGDLAGKPIFKTWKKDKTPRKSGKQNYQIVHEPNEVMIIVHRNLMEAIEKKLNPIRKHLPNAVACIKGIDAAEYFSKLASKRYILKMDLSHAYASVDVIQLAKILRNIFPEWGTTKDILIFLQKFCCDEKFGLFYGAPSSPMLFNLYCEEVLDCKIRDQLRITECTCGYIRYVDDLIFYSDNSETLPMLKEKVRQIISQTTFLENHWKTKLVDRKQGSIVVLGRQLGCLSTVIKMGNMTFSVRKKYLKLRHSIDMKYGGLPSRVIGMPSKLPVHKSLQSLERDVYRASCGGPVENPRALTGRMMWFIQSIYPSDRTLNRTERKIVEHFSIWANKNEIDTGFLRKFFNKKHKQKY